MKHDFILIGIDGGATKVNAWVVNRHEKTEVFNLTDFHSGMKYSDVEGFISHFKPVAIQIQIAERDKQIFITEEEKQQGSVFIKATATVIEDLCLKTGCQRILVGVGMPGLKSDDKRGISVVANGPRIISYASDLEKILSVKNISFVQPIAHIGSDADYCGIGELFANDGSFRGVKNAYYLGGGTGAADALILRGKLVAMDMCKNWLAKTWEMKNDLERSLERYASASGLQFIYAEKAGRSTEALNAENIFPPQIAELALQGDAAAQETFQETAKYLAMLFYERISSFYAGWQNIFGFVNPNRKIPSKTHDYREELFERLVVGQRLGDLLGSRTGIEVLTNPLIAKLSELIDRSKVLDEKVKSHYLHGERLREERFVLSGLREAPALGAGIDAYFVWKSAK